MEERVCFLCEQPTEKKCPHCQDVYFCEEKHFILHRPEQERIIHRTQLILYDKAAVIGPKYSTTSVCLECLKRKPSEMCHECKWPMCDSKCAEKKKNHSQEECAILAKNRESIQSDDSYTCIAPLRLLLVKTSNPEMYERFTYLMDHNEERIQNKESWNFYQKNVNEFLRDKCGTKEFSNEEIDRAVGLFWTNSFSCTDGGGQAIFPTFSFTSHSCLANCSHVIFPNQHLALQAKVFIPKDSEFTINYISPLQGRLKRLVKLRDKWFFNCNCPRCIDGKELGTFFSSILCQMCGTAPVIPVNANNIESDYICEDSHTMSYKEVLKLENELTMELKSTNENDAERFHELFESFSKLLHSNHYLLFLLKRHLIAVLDNNHKKDEKGILEFKIKICKEVLSTLEMIDPGLTESKGTILKQLCECQKILNRIAFQNGEISEEELSSRALECISLYKEAQKCVSLLIKK